MPKLSAARCKGVSPFEEVDHTRNASWIGLFALPRTSVSYATWSAATAYIPGTSLGFRSRLAPDLIHCLVLQWSRSR